MCSGLYYLVEKTSVRGMHGSLFQGVAENFDDLVVAVGSGGTVFGLALANYLTGSKLR